MLIQVTNKCHEGCAHCLQDSLPNGYEMSDETFKNALKFGHFLGLSDYMISGGEPTEHSDLKHLLKLFELFSIISALRRHTSSSVQMEHGCLILTSW